MEVLFLLFGLAALLFLIDSSSSEPEPEPESERITGTEGVDLIETTGGQIVEALGGNDTIISVGDDTIFAGPGSGVITWDGGSFTADNLRTLGIQTNETLAA